jgi:hypothetical protein
MPYKAESSALLIKSLSLTIIFFISMSPVVFAQQPANEKLPSSANNGQCSLTIEQAPKLRGFYLGMSVSEVTSLIPTIKIKPLFLYGPEDGVLSGVLSYFYTKDPFPNRPEFENVASLEFTFIDSKASSVIIGYNIPQDSLDTWASKVSSTFSLPTTWEDFERYGKWKRLTCRGFIIEVQATSRTTTPIIALRNIQEPEILKERLKQKREREQKKREDFKP